MTELRDFLMRYIDRPMMWGVDDCSLLIADWWSANHRHDPALHLRGTYSDEAGKNAVIEKAGGLVELVSKIAADAGAERGAANKDGDFGVIAIRGGGLACAIRSGRFWAVRSETGVAFTSDAKLVRGWSI